MEWSWITWWISVAAVIGCGLLAWLEGNWRQRPGLAMGFANHGGMWGDLLLLPIANAVIVPHLISGAWVGVAVALGTLVSLSVHAYWYRGDAVAHAGEHMWPSRRCGTWARDLSAAGWAHVIYVAAELTLLAGFLIHPVPANAALLVAMIFTVHVPIGLLQPRYFLTGRLASLREQPLLAPLLLALWGVTSVKVVGLDRLS